MYKIVLILIAISASAFAAVGDPQIKTDHPWYPGELSCSTFERLFKTQAELYKRVTGRGVESDEDKALAAWYWRNLNYWHGEEGALDYWDQGFGKGGDSRTREYWTGLFAHGYGLCGTTHSQWTAEIEQLLGHVRGRACGVAGHNSFEAYLTGGAYGKGQWCLLDHDISTVIFHPDGSRLLSIDEVKADLNTLKNPAFKPQRQRGWRVSGLEDSDAGGVYGAFNVAEYLPGYIGVPPMVHLRAGESLTRFLKPGLEDGKTFVFWGRNYKQGGIPGPERSRAWVNQPEKMFNSTKGTGYTPGQARFANAVYDYKPDFKSGTYKEGVIDEDEKHVTFEFYTPFVIASTPANDQPWGIYDVGGKNGLVISALMKEFISIPVKLSTDQGKTWQEGGKVPADLTDLAKGHQQYWLRFEAPAATLRTANISIRTVCQCNVATIPRLHDGENKITFLNGGRAVLSAGPNKDQAMAHLVDGKLGSPSVTLELATPRKEQAVHIYASSWQSSSAPPQPGKYQIEFSADAGKSWQPIVKDWQITRREPEPKDFWSQSMCYGDAVLPAGTTGPVRVRFTNEGKRPYIKVEAHLVYQPATSGATEVTFGWKEGGAEVKTASHIFAAATGKEDTSWSVPTGQKVETLWVKYSAK